LEIKTNTLKRGQIAMLGRLGCDGPSELTEYMLKLFNQVNSGQHIDFITLNGDIVGHQISQKFGASAT